MILKTFLNCVLSVIFIVTSAQGMEEEKSLVIGCHPWDANMRIFNEQHNADFLDFMVEHTGAPSQLPKNFHHIDLNDSQTYGAGNFSDFSNNHKGHYQNVILDWATYQHIRNPAAWANCAKILSDNGSLIIPVASIDFIAKVSKSRATAEELIQRKNLKEFFKKISISKAQNVIDQPECALLNRPDLLEEQKNEFVLNMEAVIIQAIK